MKSNWYCGVEGQQYGPFTWEQLRAMAAEGRIISDSFVRRDVDQQWFQAAQVPGLLPKTHSGAKKNGAGASTIGKSASASRNSDSRAMATVGGDPSKSSTAIKRPKPRTTASHSSGNIPVGQPVAAPPVAVPVGQTAAMVFAPRVSAAATTASGKAAEPPEPKKQGASPLLLVGILGGACALVTVVGVGVLVWNLTRPAEKPEQEIAAAMQREMRGALEQMATELQENPAAELNPLAGQDLQPIDGQLQNALREDLGKVTAGSPTTPIAAAAPASAAEATKLLKSVSKWTDVTQLRGVELNKLKLSLKSVWLAADEAGTRVEPAASGISAAKFVFVQLRVANAAPVPRKYKSWNAAGGTAAVLADQNDAILNLVPPTSTPAANRLMTVDVQPGQSVIDTLVFAAPSGAVEKLRLALAKSALVENVKFKNGSHFAFEIPLEVLLTGGSSGGNAVDVGQEPVIANRSNPVPTGDQPPGLIEPLNIEGEPAPEAGQPVVAAPAAAAKKKEDRPPTREELNKQFEELTKKEGGQPEAKKGEAQK